jgi:hypothetical protein
MKYRTLILLWLLLPPITLAAQKPSSVPRDTNPPTDTQAGAEAATQQTSPWLLAPLVSSSPKLGTSVGALGAYARTFDPASRVSLFGGMAQYTSTHSVIAAMFARTSFGGQFQAVGRLICERDSVQAEPQSISIDEGAPVSSPTEPACKVSVSRERPRPALGDVLLPERDQLHIADVRQITQLIGQGRSVRGNRWIRMDTGRYGARHHHALLTAFRRKTDDVTGLPVERQVGCNEPPTVRSPRGRTVGRGVSHSARRQNRAID